MIMPVHLHEDNELPDAAGTAAVGTEIERILDLARWAPSGDNTQPWRFEILGENRIAVHVTRKEKTEDIYDYNDGQGTLLATGMLLETMRIAASRFGRSVEWSYVGCEGLTHHISVGLPRRDSIKQDLRFPYIAIRSVNRRPYRTRRLSPEQKDTLKQAIGEELEIRWYETLSERLRTARLNARSTDIRLRLREAYVVHRRIIDWDRKFSPVGVPAEAIGLDSMTLRLMRWVMRSWDRVNFMNHLPGATAIPQFELDLLPGILCAGHFTIQRRNAPEPGDGPASLLRAGQAIQRFWLQAVAMGLSMQPAIAPIVFGFYEKRGGLATVNLAIKRKLEALTAKLTKTEQFDPDRTLFRGRVGWSARRAVKARSVRRPLASLILNPTDIS
jgi:hypothetical protein